MINYIIVLIYKMNLPTFSENDKIIYQRIYDNIIDKRNDIQNLKIDGDFNLNKEFWFQRDLTDDDELLFSLTYDGDLEFYGILDFSPRNINEYHMPVPKMRGVHSYTYLLLQICKNNNTKVLKFLMNTGLPINFNVTSNKYENHLSAVHMSILHRNDIITKMILDTNKYYPFVTCIRGQDLILKTLFYGNNNTILNDKIFTFAELIIYVCKYTLPYTNGILEMESNYENEIEANYLCIDYIRDNVEFDNPHECDKVNYFFEIYNENFNEKKMYKYPTRLKSTVTTLLLIYNKTETNDKYYLPIEIWLYIFPFMKVIDYY